jgi:hypothetical protein
MLPFGLPLPKMPLTTPINALLSVTHYPFFWHKPPPSAALWNGYLLTSHHAKHLSRHGDKAFDEKDRHLCRVEL